MGFFSSRISEPSSLPVNHGIVQSPSLPDKSVSQLIRSRLNGRRTHRGQLGSLRSTDCAPSFESTSEVPSHKQNQIDQSQLSEKSCQVDSRKTSTDAVTMTLAQSLNELATANADGLLNDDDYRVLRQNLFKNFASVSPPPVETPVVKSVEPGALRLSSLSRSDCITMNSARSPSLRTRTSIRSSMSSLFQRVRRRTSGKDSVQEQCQVPAVSLSHRTPLSLSTTSIPQDLGRRVSNSSLKTTRSRHTTPDLRSMSSRRSVKSIGTSSDIGGITQGSTRSLRGCEPPPSSFIARHLASPTLPWDSDEDRLRSSADIRAEIQLTEAEKQRVSAAFSLLTRQIIDPTFSGHTQVPDPRSITPGYLPSTPRVYGDHKHSTTGPHSVNLHLAVDRMSLVSQGSIASYSPSASIHVQPLGQDVLKTRYDQLGVRVGMQADEVERRKTEVGMRYQQRLDYLKARLKGAEIHERLMRK